MKTKVVLLSISTVLLIVVTSCSKTTAPTSNSSSTDGAGEHATSNTSSSNSTSARPTEVVVTGKWEQVGKDDEWKGTVDLVGMDGFLWSIEQDGSLYKTDPNSGNHTGWETRVRLRV